jgi:hypothetical protein
MLAIVALAQIDALIISKFASTCLDIHGDGEVDRRAELDDPLGRR